MTGTLEVRPMTLDDLHRATGWASDEGWNPGLEDAEAFHSVDPDGFLMGWLDGEPVAAISVVHHSPSYGFLGFYLCRPNLRGKGYGLTIWQTGMAHLGSRTVGLDGVPAQEENYRQSGFELAHYTRRHAGPVRGKSHAGCRFASEADLSTLLSMDRDVSGAERIAYLASWLRQRETRQTMVCDTGSGISAFGTIRACREGHKIGPLFAPDASVARHLIEALVKVAGANEIMIDVPDPNSSGVALAEDLDLKPIFSCARMYRGTMPIRQTGRIFGETTFELG